jgi:hypothetical protein
MIRRVLIAAATLTLVGCSRDFETEGRAMARVMRDPNDRCRLIITPGPGDTIPPMTARIDGCESRYVLLTPQGPIPVK